MEALPAKGRKNGFISCAPGTEEITRRVDHASNAAAPCAATLKASHSRFCRRSEIAPTGCVRTDLMGTGPNTTGVPGSGAAAADAGPADFSGSATPLPGVKATEASASDDIFAALSTSCTVKVEFWDLAEGAETSAA